MQRRANTPGWCRPLRTTTSCVSAIVRKYPYIPAARARVVAVSLRQAFARARSAMSETTIATSLAGRVSKNVRRELTAR